MFGKGVTPDLHRATWTFEQLLVFEAERRLLHSVGHKMVDERSMSHSLELKLAPWPRARPPNLPFKEAIRDTRGDAGLPLRPRLRNRRWGWWIRLLTLGARAIDVFVVVVVG